jgi:hypothetical protein
MVAMGVELGGTGKAGGGYINSDGLGVGSGLVCVGPGPVFWQAPIHMSKLKIKPDFSQFFTK